MSVRRLLKECDAKELADWMAYDMLDPFGGLRDDLRHGQLVATMVNLQVPKGGKTVDVKDYFYNGDKQFEAPVNRAIQQQARFRAYAVQVGTVKKAGGNGCG